MIVYLVVAKMIPDIIKKPTGITFIDDINMLLIAQKGSLTPELFLPVSSCTSRVGLNPNSRKIASLPVSFSYARGPYVARH